jgi:hypothetical protein
LQLLYEQFAKFCSAGPKIENSKPHKRTGKIYKDPNGKKVIPSNIGELLTPLGLCHWICDIPHKRSLWGDGCHSERDRVVYLSTNSFTLAEVQLLVSVLTDKFGLECTINKNNGGFRIRISSKSLPVLQSLLKDIMPAPPSEGGGLAHHLLIGCLMRHKIGL